MIRMTTVLIAASVATTLAATPVNAQEKPKEPRSILCQGKAVSPVPGPIFAEVSLSATIDFDRKLEVVLQDDKGKQELVGRQEVLGTNDLDVYVRTGSLAVLKGTGTKVILKMLWQKAGMSGGLHWACDHARLHVSLAGELVGLWKGTQGHADAVQLF